MAIMKIFVINAFFRLSDIRKPGPRQIFFLCHPSSSTAYPYISPYCQLRNPNFWIFQKWPQMTSKGPRNSNLPNRWPGHCCYYGVMSKICKKLKKIAKKSILRTLRPKLDHFPAILSQKDQTEYHFQPYD